MTGAFGAIERLDHETLVAAQKESAAAPRRRYSLSARALFALMDALYGKERTLRQIGYDERLHKQESEARMGRARFR